MISNGNEDWLEHLRDIDIKSFEWPWTEDTWKEELKRSTVKVWCTTDAPIKPLGFIAYRFKPISDMLKTNAHGTVIQILKLAAHPNHRGKGIGVSLLESVETAAKLQEVTFLITILHEENDIGRKWLIDQGFEAYTLRPKIFEDGRDGYSFLKRIEE